MPDRSRMQIEAWWTPRTGAVGYLVVDRVTRACALIDCAGADAASTPVQEGVQEAAAPVIARVRDLGAELGWILQTRLPAGQIPLAVRLMRQLGGRLGAGPATTRRARRDAGAGARTGAQAGTGAEAAAGPTPCHRFADGEVFALGGLGVRVLHTPGHAPDGVSYIVGAGADRATFVGDLLCMPDCGTACCDPAGGDARRLFRSINRVLSLPPATRLYVAHDRPPATRDAEFVSTVAEQRRSNIHVRDGIGEAAFVTLRRRLDARAQAGLRPVDAAHPA